MKKLIIILCLFFLPLQHINVAQAMFENFLDNADADGPPADGGGDRNGGGFAQGVGALFGAIAEGAGNGVSAVAQGFNEIRAYNERERIRNDQNQRDALHEKLREATQNKNDVLAATYAEEIKEFETRKAKQQEARDASSEKFWERVNETGAKAMNDAREVAKEAALERVRRAGEIQQATAVAAVQGQKAKETAIKKTKIILAELTRPRNAALVVGTVGAVLAIWKIGIPLLNRYLQLPTLAQETSLESWNEKGYRILFGAPKRENKVSDVILESQLAEQVQDLALSLKNTVKNGGFFRNILLYGPPGTGKTMLAMRLARSSGLEYIYFAASSLNQFSAEDALKKLHELFDFAKHSAKKLMIIIDEAEKLFESRSAVKDSKTAMLLNFLLTFLGTQNRDFLVVALTNRPQDLDGAFLSRCDEKIEIHAPAFPERLEILKSYLNKYLVNSGRRVPQKSGLLSKLIKKPKRPRKLVVDKDVLDEAYLQDIAQRLDGFVGRDIAKLVIGIQTKTMTRKDCCVTKEIFEAEVARMRQEALNKQQWKESYAAVV